MIWVSTSELSASHALQDQGAPLASDSQQVTCTPNLSGSICPVSPYSGQAKAVLVFADAISEMYTTQYSNITAGRGPSQLQLGLDIVRL